MKAIYLDNNATTPLDPRVLDVMLPYLAEHFGNAASKSHRFGWIAEEAVEKAREQAAQLIGVTAEEVIWTSGATESCNLAIKGIAHRYHEKGRHIVTQVTEHRAVLDTCKHLEDQGFRVTYLPVDVYGQIDPDRLQDAMTEDTILVSIMSANNEIGTVQPISEIGKLCKDRGVFFHTDATQAFGKIPLSAGQRSEVADGMGIDLLSASGHKMYGPKGAGILYLRRKNPRVLIEANIHGGGHERGLRSGTLNVPAIVGFGAAAEICMKQMEGEAQRLGRLRDKLFSGLEARLEDIVLHGPPPRGHAAQRLPNTANISFRHVESESLMSMLEDIAVSSGSACTSATPGPSHVLKALGIGDELIYSSIRFSLGRFNTEEEIERTIERIAGTVRSLRGEIGAERRATTT